MGKINKHKIIHLSSVHKPFDIRIFHKECRSLAENNFNVSLIIQHDKDEVIDKVRIIPITKELNRFYRIFRTTWQVYVKARAENGYVYHFHDPELIPIGICLKINGKKVIYDVHENVPDQILDKHWLPKGLRWLISNGVKFLEWASSRYFFDGIVTATDFIGKRFPLKKTIVVKNFPKLSSQSEELTSVPYKQRSPHVIYVGGITEQRGIKEMIKAIELVPKQRGANLHLAGEFVPHNLFLEAQEMAGWDRVTFFGLMPHKKVLTMFQSVRIGIAILHPTKQYIESLPIKLFEYMSAGLPVIVSNFPLWKEIIEKHNCGILVDPFDSKRVAQAIEWLLQNPDEAEEMGKRGQEAVRRFYNWEGEEKKLLQFYKKIVSCDS